jgi:hypothetical protein
VAPTLLMHASYLCMGQTVHAKALNAAVCFTREMEGLHSGAMMS